MAIITTQFLTQAAATAAIDSAAGALSLDSAIAAFEDFTDSDLGAATLTGGPNESPIHISGTFIGGATFDMRGGNLTGPTGTATVLRLEFTDGDNVLVATTGAPGAAGGLSVNKTTGDVTGSILAFDYLDPGVLHIAFSGTASVVTGAITVKSALYEDLASGITIQVGSTGGFTLNPAGTVTGGTINSASLTVGGVTMSASGLAVSALAFFGNGTTIMPTPEQQYALIFSGNDSITAFADGQELAGGKGNDTYDIGTHAGVLITEDSILGGGTDTVRTGVNYALDDNVENALLLGEGITLTGNALKNLLTGSAASNTLDGGAGNDTTVGGAGNDYFITDATGDVITELVNGGTDTTESNVMNDTLDANVENMILGSIALNGTGNALNNTITGNGSINRIDGGGGNDSIDGIAGGPDTLLGGAGNDTLASYNIADSIDGGAGIDKVILNAGEGTFTLGAMTENLDLRGGDPVTAIGNALANLISSQAVINDIIDGAGGNDVYELQAGDLANESLAGAMGGTDVVIAEESFTLGTNIENLILDASSMTGTGNELGNVLASVSGSNTLVGAAGNDTYNVHDTDVAQEVDSASGGTADMVIATLDDTESYTLGAGVENLALIYEDLPGPGSITGIGNAGNNRIAGAAVQNNYLQGAEGNDTLNGGAGNDTLEGGSGGNSLSGGAGNDVFIIELINTGGVTGFTAGTSAVDSGGIDTLKLVGGDGPNSTFTLTLPAVLENVDFSGADDNITVNVTGGAAANVLIGGLNADTLTGGGGNDTLIGGLQLDSLVGGTGNDYYVRLGADTIAESVNGGTDVVEFAGDGSTQTIAGFLANIEGIVLNDTMLGGVLGGAGNDFLGSKDGVHTLNGGSSGNDTYSVHDGDIVVDDDSVAGAGHIDLIIATLSDGEDWDLHSTDYVENLTLLYGPLPGSITGIGNDLANVITGAKDAYSSNNLQGDSSNDTLIGAGGNDTLSGDDGIDSLVGGLGDDQYDIRLKASITGALEDMFSDTGGIDTLVVHGNDTVTAWSYTMAGALENLDFEDTGIVAAIVAGNALANDIEANAGDNKLDGAAGNDTIDACDGNDTVLGGAGDDLLEGGLDNDSLDGGLGNDEYVENFGDDIFVIAQAGDSIDVASSGGIDTVRVALLGNTYLNLGNHTFLENAVFTGTGNAILFGNDSENQLTGGAGNDSLSGGLDGDKLNGGAGADTLDGGADGDTMAGGAGNDRYLVDHVGDDVVESMAGGTDTVIVSVENYTLDANVENLILANGVGSGTGSAGANTITGNAEDNSLSGGGGNDVVTGGAGNDFFYMDFITANNVMRITDFEQGEDLIYLNGELSGLTGSLEEGTTLVNANLIPATVGGAASLIYVASTGSLYYDPNGGATTDKVLIATFDLAHRPYAMHEDDFTTS